MIATKVRMMITEACKDKGGIDYKRLVVYGQIRITKFLALALALGFVGAYLAVCAIFTFHNIGCVWRDLGE